MLFESLVVQKLKVTPIIKNIITLKLLTMPQYMILELFEIFEIPRASLGILSVFKATIVIVEFLTKHQGLNHFLNRNKTMNSKS
jgi:hypothetical protein